MFDQMLLMMEVLAVFFYGLATITFALKKVPKLSSCFWCIAVCFNGMVVLNNWMINGYVPFVSMYQVLTFLSLVFAPIYLLVKYRYEGGWMRGCFSCASAICMI